MPAQNDHIPTLDTSEQPGMIVPGASDPLVYYTDHSLVTDPRAYVSCFADLPTEIPALCAVVQGHPLASYLYGEQLSSLRKQDLQTRRVSKMLKSLLEIDDRPLTVPRTPRYRIAGNCRDYAVLLCSILRHQGVPARARVGVLDMDVQEALTQFADHPRLAHILGTLHAVGLDCIKLGQSATTLSGGEAQRVKLARELSRASTGRTLYILDEPTTGLHFADIQRLLDVLHRLVDAGNTVIVIEHNLDVIKTADWLIDLGPEGGEDGGHIVAQGAPEHVATVRESHTGRFLRDVLALKQKAE